MRLLPNVATFGNLMSGFFALLLSAQGDVARAAVLLVVAAGFDLLDGLFARRATGDEADGNANPNVLGGNLDSLADLVSFGVAPAFALHASTLHAVPVVPVVGSGACLIFLACAAWRLARFPLVRREGYFVGLPAPPAGLAVAGLAVLSPPPAVALGVVALLCVLMVGTLPFPDPFKALSGKRPTRRRL